MFTLRLSPGDQPPCSLRDKSTFSFGRNNKFEHFSVWSLKRCQPIQPPFCSGRFNILCIPSCLVNTSGSFMLCRDTILLHWFIKHTIYILFRHHAVQRLRRLAGCRFDFAANLLHLMQQMSCSRQSSQPWMFKTTSSKADSPVQMNRRSRAILKPLTPLAEPLQRTHLFWIQCDV